MDMRDDFHGAMREMLPMLLATTHVSYPQAFFFYPSPSPPKSLLLGLEQRQARNMLFFYVATSSATSGGLRRLDGTSSDCLPNTHGVNHDSQVMQKEDGITPCPHSQGASLASMGRYVCSP